MPSERFTSKKKESKKQNKKRAKTTDAEPKEPASFVPVDIDEYAKLVIAKIKALRSKRKHLILLIDEIDSFSRSGQKKTNNERDFKRLLKLITNDGDLKSKFREPNKNGSSTKQKQEQERSPSKGRNKRKRRKDASP